MKRITLYQNILIKNSKIKISLANELIKCGFVCDEFWVMYPDTNVSNLDESILNIPLLANIAPVIWALGLKVNVPVMDRTFLESLKRLKPIYKSMYPKMLWNGELIPEKVTYNSNEINSQNSGENSGIFFSGGLDSVSSTMDYIDDKLMLISIRGSDISLKDDLGWSLVVKQTQEFSERYGLTCNFVESNFYEFLNQEALSDLDNDISNWWGGVQHGLGFAGLIAPYTVINNIGKFYISSTHSKGFNSPWGSNPKLDNSISYVKTKFQHHGYEFTRQEKVKRLIKKCELEGLPFPSLRVCYKNKLNAGENCCICEKCSRTMTSLWAEGNNPEEFGFGLPNDKFVENISTNFHRKKILFDDNLVFQWENIQSNLYPKNYYTQKKLPKNIISYLEWLRHFDFLLYKKKTQQNHAVYQRLLKVLRKYPSLISFLKFLKNSKLSRR